MNRPPYSPKNGPGSSRRLRVESARTRSQEALDRRDRVVAGHERLADQHDIRSRRAVVGDVRGLLDRRFGDPDDARRDAVGERPEEVAVEFEGAEIARVDADDRGADVEGALDLFGRMRLDERRHAELDDELVELGEPVLLERGDDEQHEVRARGACLEHLVRLGDEVFAQHRDRRRRRAPGRGRRAIRRSAAPRSAR